MPNSNRPELVFLERLLLALRRQCPDSCGRLVISYEVIPYIPILAYLTFQDVGMMRLKYLLAQTMRSKDTNLLSTSLTIDSRTFSTVEPGSNQMMGKESLHTVQDAAG